MARSPEYKQRHREYMKRYLAEKGEEINAKRREQRKSTAGDKVRAKQREKYARHKEKIRAQQNEAWAKNKDYFNRRQNARRYKISIEEYDRMMAMPCMICAATEGLHIDHCHSTGEVRGTLCTRCNTGLGLFRENPEFLYKAMEYLSQPQRIKAA